MLIDKADRTIQGFVKRLEHFREDGHFHGGLPKFLEICSDIRAGELIGTRDENSVLSAFVADIAREFGTRVVTDADIRNTKRHIFEQKNDLPVVTDRTVRVHGQSRTCA